MINKIWKILLSGLLAICLVMFTCVDDRAFAQIPPPSANRPQYIAIPDYLGQKITFYKQTTATFPPQKPTPTLFATLITANCNPNSVTYNNSKLYVACNKDSGNQDFIGVYNLNGSNSPLTPTKPTATINKPFDQTIASDQFNSIISIAFDPDNNLWVSSYGNSQIVRIPKASLATPDPTPDKALINSPISPVGITFDKNGSLWATGQYQGGIVLKIPKTELDQPGTIDGGIPKIDATPSYCISNNADGCQQQAGLFDNPEGIAILNNDIWVSNNGNDHPAASLVRLRISQGTVDRFGNGVGAPFSCPGGLKAVSSGLLVNDQSAPLTNTTCGANDPTSGVGRVFIYKPTDLTSPSSLNLNPLKLSNVTSRPGFGGIDVF
jgi:Two component regulator propeller